MPDFLGIRVILVTISKSDRLAKGRIDLKFHFIWCSSRSTNKKINTIELSAETIVE
ncbi:MAG: hypothetical protein P8N75_03495 [Ascidiaceihabitans sp.]|jgi:hypothetical protein|nr:hypothetical protein [Ascidiaceihabitans sp.]MDG1102436.1 hypothetical protein [Ascidiaceihabitans sp.]